MKKSLLVKLLGFAILTVTGSAQAVIVFNANLTHDQEVTAPAPPIPNEGSSGIATFVLNDAQDTLTYDIRLFGLDLGRVNTAPGQNGISNLPAPPGDANDDVTRVHIHSAAFGVNGGIVFGMIENATNAPATLDDLDDLVVDKPGLHITGAWDLTEGSGLGNFLDELFAFGLYLNVHTSDHGGGEIRGQIIPEPGTVALLGLGLAAFGLRRRKAA